MPGVHALGSATSGATDGDTMVTTERSNDQPRPKCPHFSTRAFARPQSANCFRVHSFARFMAGEPVRRAPMTSVSSCAVSITWERAKPSVRMREIATRSTVSGGVVRARADDVSAAAITAAKANLRSIPWSPHPRSDSRLGPRGEPSMLPRALAGC